MKCKRSFYNLVGLMIIMSLIISAIPVRSAMAYSKTGWLWPVSPSVRRLIRGYRSDHSGLDIAVSAGSKVYASKAGTVIQVYTGCNSNSVASIKNSRTCSSSTCSPSSSNFQPYTMGSKSYKACNYGYGNGVVIKHSDDSISMYAHMSTVVVSRGQNVSQGQEIGTSGSTGNSEGAHLHFEIASSYTPSKIYAATYINPASVNNNPDSPDYHITSSNTTGLSVSSEGYVYHTNGVSYVFSTVPEPGKATLSVTPGTSQSETTFRWNVTGNTSYYTLRIRDSSGELYTMQGGIEGTSFSIVLPAGTYTAYLASVNSEYSVWTYSNDVGFTVATDSSENPPSKPSLSVTAGTCLDETYFSWSTTTNTSYYTIRIYDKDTSNEEPYVIRGGIPVNYFYAILPAGNYYATLASVNKPAENWTFSDAVHFSVSGKSVPSLGDLVAEIEENHKLFSLYSGAQDWLAAEAIAKAHNGRLASITSQAEQDAVAAIVTEFNSSCWLGAETFRSGAWCWQDGSGLSYTNWEETQPDNGFGKENCLQMVPGGTWNDRANKATIGTSWYNVKGYVVQYAPRAIKVLSMVDSKQEGDDIRQDDVVVLVTFNNESVLTTNDYSISVSGTTAGTQTVTVTYGSLTDSVPIEYVVKRTMQSPDFVIPDSTTIIGSEAFCGLDMRIVKCPDGLEEIGSGAFKNCLNLEEIYIPATVAEIPDNICEGSPDGLTVFGYRGTAAETFALEYGYDFVFVD